jgi:protein SCO1/2
LRVTAISKPFWQKILLLTGGGIFILFTVAALLFAVFQPVKVLPRIRLSPGFALFNQKAEKLTNEDLRGHIVLYNFTYTQCPVPCADMNETMQAIQANVEKMALNGVPFTLVTISFDPTHDTPAVLQTYAATVGAEAPQWHFATLDNPDLLKTIVGGGFEAYYEQKPDGSFKFSPTFVLVDGWGIIRGQYRYETISSDVDRITRHINVLVEEVEKSVGANKLVYEAAHLFMCYAP